MGSIKLTATISGIGRSFSFGLIGLSVFAASFVPTASEAAKTRRIDRSAEIVVNADTGTVIYEDNATVRRYPASITKVMTLYLLFDAIESGRVGLDDRIVFSRNADNQPPTALGVRAGDSISVETAILSLALRSANDSATAVAEFIGGTERNFAQMMNAKARELGMNSTNFINASGLPNPNQYTTAEDLAKLAIAIRRDFPRQFHWFSRQSFVYNGEVITNHNHLVGKYEGVDGLKTGYIRASGFNLAATATRGGHRIVTVVMGGPNRHVRDDRVVSLLNNAFASLGVVQMGENGKVDFSENSSDERDAADSFALAGLDEDFATNVQAPKQMPSSASNNIASNRAIVGFSWRAPSSETTIATNSLNTARSANFPIKIVNASNDTQLHANTAVQPSPIVTRVAETQTSKSNPQPIETSALAEETKPAATQTTYSVQATNDPLPQFIVTAQVQNSNVSQEAAATESEITNIDNSAQTILVANNEDLKLVETLREEAALRENERIKAIEIAEAKIEAERQAQLRQRQAEVRRLAEIQKRAEERRERQRIQLAEENKARQAREARAKAEKEEQQRQFALANQRGNVTIQIGAFKERGDAQAALASMARHFPSFASKQVTTFSQSGSTWFRARVSGLGVSAAQTACRAVTRSGGRCTIVSR